MCAQGRFSSWKSRDGKRRVEVRRAARRGGAWLFAGILLLAAAGAFHYLTARSPGEVLILGLEVARAGAVPAAVDGAGAAGTDDIPGWRSRIVSVPSSGPRVEPAPLTRGFQDASSPALSYDGAWLLFAGRRGPGEPWALWEMRADGSHRRRVTGGNGEPRDPCYLPDGKIVFSDRASLPEPVASGGGRSLFICDRDGSRMRRITFGAGGDSRPGVLDDGRVLFERRAASEAGGDPPAQMIVNPDGTGLARFDGGSIRPAAEEPAWGGADGGGVLPGEKVVSVLRAAPRSQPRPLTSVVDETKDSGRLLCLDVYQSRIARIAQLRPGEVETVRVYEAAAPGDAKLLGEAPVEPDGSFYMEAPVDTPLRLELVGHAGRALASCHGGVWVRPNESRACIGCHEDPDLAPENRLPQAVRKSPVRLGAAATPGAGAENRE